MDNNIVTTPHKQTHGEKLANLPTRNEKAKQEISVALQGIGLKMEGFSYLEQLQLIKFFNIATRDERIKLLGAIEFSQTSGGNFNDIQGYITKIKSPHTLEHIKEHAQRFDNDSPEIEIKKKEKKKEQAEPEKKVSTRRKANNEAAQIIADHEKKEGEFAKQDKQLQESKKSLETLELEISELIKQRDGIEELRNVALSQVNKLRGAQKISTLRKKVDNLKKNYVFSDSIVEVIYKDNELQLHLYSGKNVTIDEFILSVENDEILIEKFNGEKWLYITKQQFDALNEEIGEKLVNQKDIQDLIESTKELESKKQEYHKINNEDVETAKEKLAIFEARKKKLKELSEGRREGIIGYAHDLATKSEFNYQVKTLPDELEALENTNNELQEKKNKLTKKLKDMAANPLGDRGDDDMETIRQEIIGIDMEISINELKIDRINEKIDNDPLFEDAREKERKKIQDLENIVTEIQKELDDKPKELPEARIIPSEHGEHIGKSVEINVLEKRLNGTLGIEEEVNGVNKVETDEDENLIPETYECNKVIYTKVEGKKHTYKHPEKDLYIIVPIDNSPVRFVNNKTTSINSVEYGREIGEASNCVIAQACSETGEYAQIKIDQNESYTIGIPISEKIVITNDTLQCIITKNGVGILASLPLTEDNSGKITLRYKKGDANINQTIPQNELLDNLNKITSIDEEATGDGGKASSTTDHQEVNLNNKNITKQTVIVKNVKKKDAESIFLKQIQTIDSDITSCEVEYTRNEFIITFKGTIDGTEVKIRCTMKNQGTGIKFDLFGCNNPEKYSKIKMEKLPELGRLIWDYYSSDKKFRSINITQQGQPGEVLELTYENDDKGGGEAFGDIPLIINDGDDNWSGNNDNGSGSNDHNLQDGVGDYIAEDKAPQLMEGTKFIYLDSSYNYVVSKDGGVTFDDAKYEWYVNDAANENEIIQNSSRRKIDFYCPNLDLKVNEEYDYPLVILEYTTKDSDFIITEDPSNSSESVSREGVSREGVYLSNYFQDFAVLIVKGASGTEYRLIQKDDDKNPGVRGKFTSLNACLQFTKSKEDKISGCHYDVDISTKDAESNIINKFTIYNQSGETREIALADTDYYDVDIPDEDDKGKFTHIDSTITSQPYICLMANDIPLILSFDGKIYGKNKDGKWIIINPNQGNPGQDDNADLQVYIEGLEKELSNEDFSKVMIDLINQSEFMKKKEGIYTPEVSFTGHGERITMTVILRPKPHVRFNLNINLFAPVSFDCLIENDVNGITIGDPQQIRVGIATPKEKVEGGFGIINSNFLGSLNTDKKAVKSLKIKKGKLMVTYQTKKS